MRYLSCLFVSLLLAIPAQAEIVQLAGHLSAANQNGSDPSRVTDPNGVVDTNATGLILGLLDTSNFTFDFELRVNGIQRTSLFDFGPNSTPIHLHLANGDPGNFGPIIVDLTLGATAADFTDTANGFVLNRMVSVLEADQGNVTTHPGDGQIVGALQSGNTFVLVHTDNPNINGFPFGEIRGNLNAVPEPTGFGLLGLLGLAAFRRIRRGQPSTID